MSANAETQTPQQPVKKSGKRKRLAPPSHLALYNYCRSDRDLLVWYCVIFENR